MFSSCYSKLSAACSVDDGQMIIGGAIDVTSQRILAPQLEIPEAKEANLAIFKPASFFIVYV
jgi:hypothetical protein